MKFKTLFLSALLLFFVSACTPDNTPIAGKNYLQLPETLNSEQLSPITEVFSLACGHCKKLEPLLPFLEESTGQDIKKMHIIFNKSARMASMLYYAAEIQTGNKPDATFMTDLFNAVQMPQSSTDQQRKIAINKAFETRNLVSPFNYNEQQTEVLLKRVDEVALLSEQTKINSVPTFIINGKYQVILSGHDSTEDLVKTIKYLLAK